MNIIVIVSEGTVLDDGTTIHQPGARVELEDSEAKRLIAAGKVQPIGLEIQEKLELEERELDALVNAIAALPMDDQSLWTRTGEPKVDVLADRLNREVSAEERNLAWKVYMERK